MAVAGWVVRLSESPIAYSLVYDFVILFWSTIISIFFRETRPRGAYNIPRDGPVIFAAAPHHNQVCLSHGGVRDQPKLNRDTVP